MHLHPHVSTHLSTHFNRKKTQHVQFFTSILQVIHKLAYDIQLQIDREYQQAVELFKDYREDVVVTVCERMEMERGRVFGEMVERLCGVVRGCRGGEKEQGIEKVKEEKVKEKEKQKEIQEKEKMQEKKEKKILKKDGEDVGPEGAVLLRHSDAEGNILKPSIQMKRNNSNTVSSSSQVQKGQFRAVDKIRQQHQQPQLQLIKKPQSTTITKPGPIQQSNPLQSPIKPSQQLKGSSNGLNSYSQPYMQTPHPDNPNHNSHHIQSTQPPSPFLQKLKQRRQIQSPQPHSPNLPTTNPQPSPSSTPFQKPLKQQKIQLLKRPQICQSLDNYLNKQARQMLQRSQNQNRYGANINNTNNNSSNSRNSMRRSMTRRYDTPQRGERQYGGCESDQKGLLVVERRVEERLGRNGVNREREKDDVRRVDLVSKKLGQSGNSNGGNGYGNALISPIQRYRIQ